MFDLLRALFRRDALHWSQLGELAACLLEFFDSTHVIVLVLIAAVADRVAEQFRPDEELRRYGRIVSVTFLVAYAAHLYPTLDLGVEVLETIAALVRALVATSIMHSCFSLPGVFLGRFTLQYLQTKAFRLRRSWEDLAEERRKCREEEEARRRAPQPSPSVPREFAMRQASEQARLDFDFECQIIRAADLEKEEEEAALLQAKQKYLQKLNDALQ